MYFCGVSFEVTKIFENSYFNSTLKMSGETLGFYH